MNLCGKHPIPPQTVIGVLPYLLETKPNPLNLDLDNLYQKIVLTDTLIP